MKIVELMAYESKLGKNGHDLETWHLWANGSLGYQIRRSKESVRIAKEALQARGIILVDGMKWEDHVKEVDGSLVRARTPYKQRIEFTKEFIGWFRECVAQRKIVSSRQFGYCDNYIMKKEGMTVRARLAKMKYNAEKLFITVCNSCESVAKELVGGVTHSLGSFGKIQSKLNNKDTNLNPYGCFPSQENNSLKDKFRNPLIANLSSYTEKKVKLWTDATTRICKQLIDSGMTKIDVARSMIHQNYVNSIKEFEAKYSQQMNC
jgi:hypothetical protein